MLQEVGTVIYQQAAAEQAKQKEQQGAAAGPEPGPSPGEDKVVDSEDYKVK